MGLTQEERVAKQGSKLFLALAAVAELEIDFQLKVYDVAIQKLESNGINVTADHVRNLRNELAELWGRS